MEGRTFIAVSSSFSRPLQRTCLDGNRTCLDDNPHDRGGKILTRGKTPRPSAPPGDGSRRKPPQISTNQFGTRVAFKSAIDMTAAASRVGALHWRGSMIVGVSVVGIVTHLALRWGADTSPAIADLPLYVVLTTGGVPLVMSLA